MSQVSAAYGSDSGFSGKANVNEHSMREKRKRAPAATDDGVAIGAALAAPVAAGFGCGEMTKAYLGSQSAPEEIEAVLRTYKLSYKQLDDPAETAADLVTGGKLIGWYQGREELGPRALGNRSMLADRRCS